MVLNCKKFNEWKVSELELLINNEDYKESEFLDYKEDFQINEDFKNDICAFANHLGGYILYGIEEKRVGKNKTGIAGLIKGIDNIGLDSFELNIANALSSSIEPSRPMFSINLITISEDKCVLALKICEGDDKPYCSKQKKIFRVRGNAGNEIMSYSQIQESFDMHHIMQNNLGKFLNDRMEFLCDIRNTSYFNYNKSPLMAVHYIPLSAISGRQHNFNVSNFKARVIKNIGKSQHPWKLAIQNRVNMDGIMLYKTAGEMLAHIQIFRNGSIEFSNNYFSNRNVSEYANILVDTIKISNEIFTKLGLNEPFLCVISFENVKTYLDKKFFDRNSIRSSSVRFENNSTAFSEDMGIALLDELGYLIGEKDYGKTHLINITA